MTVAVAPISGYSGSTRFSVSGFSEAAVKLKKELAEIISHQRRTGSAQTCALEALSKLGEVARTCVKPNWGGTGEEPITQEAIDEAMELIELLPPRFQAPEIVPEPAGTIALEWRFGHFRTIVLSLSGQRVIEYAGLLGRKNQFYGRRVFAAELPEPIYGHMRELARA